MNGFDLTTIKSGFYIEINVEAEKFSKKASVQLLEILNTLIEYFNKLVVNEKKEFVVVFNFSNFAYIDTYCLARLITLKTIIKNKNGKILVVSSVEKVQRFLIASKMDKEFGLVPSLDDVSNFF